jgi:hypothetical protein
LTLKEPKTKDAKVKTQLANSSISTASRRLLLLIFFATITVAPGAEIKSKSTLTLAPLETLTTENALRQGLRIAEIGMTELTAQAASLEEEEKVLEGEVASFDKKQKEEQATVAKLDARFAEAKKQYEGRLGAYEGRKRVHDADALKQRAAAEASNALAPKQRNAATVSQINTWGETVNARKTELGQEAALLKQEYDVAESKRQTVLTYREGAEERLKKIHDSLEAKIKAHTFKKGLAYRQLQQCADYAVQIRKILATKFNIPVPISPILDTSLEQLKRASNAGFDTP